MKAFKNITIRNNQERLISLLQEMRSASGLPFEYRAKLSEQYANMIFSDRSKVACFKTNRVSLFESVVWVLVTEEKLIVTNITSEKNTNLGISNYNLILDRFFQDFVAKFIDETFSVQISGEVVELSEILPAEVYEKLDLWADTCNKDGGVCHPLDYQRWMEFVVAAHNYQIELSPADLEKWLHEDKMWPVGYNDTIDKLAVMYEYGRDLLNLVKDEA